MVKIKDKNHHLAIAIKENYAAGMKPKEIASLFHISKQRVNYWIHHSIKTRKRRTKLTLKEIFIGLCLDKKLLDDFNKDEEKLYDEDKMENEIDEEMELEEDNA